MRFALVARVLRGSSRKSDKRGRFKKEFPYNKCH